MKMTQQQHLAGVSFAFSLLSFQWQSDNVNDTRDMKQIKITFSTNFALKKLLMIVIVSEPDRNG